MFSMDASDLSKLGRADAVSLSSGEKQGRPPEVLGKEAWHGGQGLGPTTSGLAEPGLSYIASAECLAEPDNEVRAILTSIAEGDRHAFWALWQRYQNHLFAVCCRKMGGVRADAEDALSEAMLRALDTIPQHARALINPEAWLTRLTCNVCMEIHRQRCRRWGKRDSNRSFEANGDPAMGLRTSPEDILLDGEMFTVMIQTVEGLTTRLRETFVLRFALEMSCREVAEQLRLSNENVRKRIQESRAILREELARYLTGTGRPTNQQPRESAVRKRRIPPARGRAGTDPKRRKSSRGNSAPANR
jgi:RNA polymerase sigma factor (sigma-70 family)